MNKADEQYKRLIEKIYKEGIWDKGEKVRTVYADGEPAYTKSIFGVQVEFEKGIIPILTSKKVFSTTALKELLLFWVKQTVQEKDFKDEKVKVWQEWFNKDGNLGRSYAYQFESHRHHTREIVKVKRKLKEIHGELGTIKLNVEDIIGDFEILKSNNFGKFKVLKTFPTGTHYNNSQSYEIQFINTLSKKIVRKYDAINGEVSDNYARTVRGVGYLGNTDSVNNYSKEEKAILYIKWENMISRCYSHDEYNRYKNIGVFVDPSWHSFENFLRDIRYIPQFFLAKEDGFKGWSIDKDYYGSNAYSKDTCVWLTSKENDIYRVENKPFISIDKYGNKKLYISIKECAKDIGVANGSGIGGCLNKRPNRKTVKGYSFEYLDDNEHLYRYELSRNQVVELLNNVKNNSQSRRLMTSFWNYAEVDKKELQECAWATNWNIKSNTLDLILIQRSADVGLGVVFNWIQYYFLQNMIAHVSGLEVGRFIHQIGNLHYYDRHEEVLLKQIENKIFDMPKIWINPEIKDFFDFTHNDIKLLDYECGEYVGMEVAI